jgi:hypothetical protein
MTASLSRKKWRVHLGLLTMNCEYFSGYSSYNDSTFKFYVKKRFLSNVDFSMVKVI